MKNYNEALDGLIGFVMGGVCVGLFIALIFYNMGSNAKDKEWRLKLVKSGSHCPSGTSC